MSTPADRTKYLVCHDYGMGGLWWWVIADSAEDIRRRIAEVTVVTDPEAIARAEPLNPQTIDIEEPVMDPALQALMTARSRQINQPGFGRFRAETDCSFECRGSMVKSGTSSWTGKVSAFARSQFAMA